MDSKLKILHIVPTYVPATRYGGPIYSVHGLCQSLASLGHNVEVFTTNADGDQDSDVPIQKRVMLDGVGVWYFRSRYLRRLYWSPDMRRALQSQLNRFDIVHLHSVFLWPTYVAAREALRQKIPYIISPRGMLVKELIREKSYWVKSLWLGLVEKKNLEHAAAIHATSQKEIEGLQSFGYQLPKLFMIPNGVDGSKPGSSSLKALQKLEQTIKGQKFILFLGRIHWKKRIDWIIQAFSNIPNIHLIIAGQDESGCQAYLTKQIVELKLQSRIHFWEYADTESKKVLFQQAELLCLPSINENFGNVVIEALSHGCPTIVTPHVGTAEWIQKYSLGIVADDNPISFEHALQSFLEDEGFRMKIRGKAPILIQQMFSWSVIAAQMEQEYHEILRRKI